MSNVVRVEYPDLSTELQPNEAILTGDSLEVFARQDQRSIIEVQTGDTGVSITGSPFDDSITGGAGNDSIVGGEGNDFLEIGSGDTVSSGAGNDSIVLDLSQDFDFNNPPTISDFRSGEDQFSFISNNDSISAVFDEETNTLLVDGEPVVQLEEELSLSASDLDFGGEELLLDTIDSSETTLYEFFDPSREIYFYTVNEEEKASIEDNLSNYVLRTDTYDSINPVTDANAEEVYRFYNESTGAHLFTTSEVERDSIQENLSNYNYEGTVFYGYETEVEGSVPIHRFYNPVEDLHVYTHSQAEMESMMNNDAFNDEGTAFYVMPSGFDAPVVVE